VNKSNINCQVCKSNLLIKPILTLKKVPSSAQGFVKLSQKKNNINLKIYQCSFCGLVQTINKPVSYYKETIRAVGFSKKMINYRSKQFKKFIKKFNLKKGSIVEIGSGNGEYLKILQKYCKKAIGLEFSKNNFLLSKKRGLKVVKGYVENKKFKIPGGPFDGFICMSFMEHSPDVNKFLKGIFFNLNDDGYGLVEVPNFDMILKKELYTEFIIDHINYFTKDTLSQTLNINGFEVLSCNEIWDGYIISALIKKKKIFKELNINKIINKIKIDYKKFKKKINNKKIIIWGAGHQSLTVLSLTGINKDIKYIIDSATFKQNRFSPGDKIKVVSPSILKKENFGGIIIIAAGYSDEVYNILRKKKFPGKIAILRHDHFEFK